MNSLPEYRKIPRQKRLTASLARRGKIFPRRPAPLDITGQTKNDQKKFLTKCPPFICLAGLLLNEEADKLMSVFKQAVTIFFSAGKAEKEGELRGMTGNGLRSRVHGCSRFFKREGEENLRCMKGMGLRSYLHFESAGSGNSPSFLLISPVFPPDIFFHLANSSPIVLNRTAQTMALRPGGFHLVRAGEAEPDG